MSDTGPRDDGQPVSAIIPARSAADTLPAALASIAAQDVTVVEIVVAVPEWDAATRAAAMDCNTARVPVVVVDNPTGRTPDGLNAALEAASGEIIARVDAHAVLPPGYLSTALDVLGRDDRIGNVGGRQRPVGSDAVSRAIAAAMVSPLGSGGARHRGGTDAGPSETVYLGVFRAAALADVGGFDSRFTRNQDYELNVRLRERGWTVWFDPALAVDYHPRSSLTALARQYFEYGRWRRATLHLHPGSRLPRQVALPAALLFFLVASMVGVATGQPLVGPVLFAAWVVSLVVAGIVGRGANPLLVAVALATIHASWTTGLLLGPPRGWRAAEARPAGP